MNASRSRILAHPETIIHPDETERLSLLLAQRLQHRPMAYILGNKSFRHLTLSVSEGVLIPRPETEELVDLVIQHWPDPATILDAGSGSGCLVISLSDAYPTARITALDYSRAALEIARRNDPGNRINWIQSDWCDCIQDESFDLIVSNPPYLTEIEMETLEPQVARYEPRLALSGGSDGCDCYRKLIPAAYRCLSPGGGLAFEGSPSVAVKVQDLLEIQGFTKVQIFPDLAGLDRFILASRPA
jgi:release factor glutamine methyltransferase